MELPHWVTKPSGTARFWGSFRRVGTNLILGSKMFQRVGSTAEKSRILPAEIPWLIGSAVCPFCQHEWGRSIPSGWGSSSDKLNPCHAGLQRWCPTPWMHLEADWEPVQLTKRWCNLSHSRDLKNCLHSAPAVAFECSSRIAYYLVLKFQ